MSLHQYSSGLLPSSSRSSQTPWDHSAWASSSVVRQQPLSIQQLRVTQSMLIRPNKWAERGGRHTSGMDFIKRRDDGGDGDAGFRLCLATGEEPLSSGALSAAISSCTTLAQHSSLYSSHGGSMDLFHCAAMMGRLPKTTELHYMARQQLPDQYLTLTDDLVKRVESDLDM